MHIGVFIGLAAVGILAGASVVMQQVMVASLRAALGSAVWAVLISYVGGTLAMLLLLAMTREPLTAEGFARSNWMSWGAGLFGVIYITLAILLIPRLGAATMLALLVAGQLLASITFDHFGLFGLARQPVDTARILGALMLLGGVVLIRS